MIRSLTINNIALIDKLQLDFEEGLTVLSGETGSGKSIIIDSLAFVLGERADKTLIKHGQSKAFVEVVFETQDKGILELVEDLGFESDGTIVIARTMTDTGKNDCRVNGRSCTASMLKTLTTRLVDIFGQSQHLNLLRPDNHLAVLDGFCKFGNLMSDAESLYEHYKDIEKQLKRFGGSEAERQRALDMLSYQIDELEKADLSEEEEEELEAAHKRLVNIEKIATAVDSALQYLSRGEGAVTQLSLARNNINNASAYDEQLNSVSSRLEQLYIEADDVSQTLEQYLSDTQYSASEADRIEERRERIRTLKRKYGGTVAKALEFLADAKIQYANLVDSDEQIARLLKEKSDIVRQLFSVSKKISAVRHKQAEIFAEDIRTQLDDLGMKGTQFAVQFNDDVNEENYEQYVSANGYDSAEFLFSANKGEPLKPLSKVISGGEMSRFMLAVKNITAKVENIPTMVFDEIDTGISGNMAQKVAIKLAKVSKDYQCLVITHLPHIVAMADNNIVITKGEESGRTVSHARHIDRTEKAMEVARLMGGVGQHSIVNANELIDWAASFKSEK